MAAVFSTSAALLAPPLLLVGWGALLSRLVLSRRDAALAPFLSPALGLALVASIGPAAGALGFPLAALCWPLAALSALGWVLLLRGGGTNRWLRAHGPALLVAAAGFALVLTPLLHAGRLTTVGTSIDAISYVARS